MVIPRCLSFRRLSASLSLLAIGLLIALVPGGCQLAGVMADTYERTKIVDISAEYRGLENRRAAVLIDAPMDIQYEFPQSVPVLTDFISIRISANVPGALLLTTRDVLAYQNRRVNWTQMDYRELAGELGVERLIIIDLVEYRLFEPGNAYYWSGRITADVNIYEVESDSPFDFAYSKNVVARFPTENAVGRNQASQSQVELGLQLDFTQHVSWLFYDHRRQNQELMDESREAKDTFG